MANSIRVTPCIVSGTVNLGTHRGKETKSSKLEPFEDHKYIVIECSNKRLLYSPDSGRPKYSVEIKRPKRTEETLFDKLEWAIEFYNDDGRWM